MLSSSNLCVSIFIFTFSCRPLIPTAWGFFDIFCSSLQILRYASWPCLHSDRMPKNILFKIGLLVNYNINIYDHVCEYICYLFQLKLDWQISYIYSSSSHEKLGKAYFATLLTGTWYLDNMKDNDAITFYFHRSIWPFKHNETVNNI